MIPQEVIQEIIEKVDIVEWVEQYVPLKRAGSEWKGLCPFHNEKTPSFGVTPSKGSFYCFGCQEGGNIIGFVQLYENLSFPEAARRLADVAGISIVEEEVDPQQEARRKRRSTLIRLQESAADFFHLNLMKSRGAGAQAARDYLKNRQLGQEIAREWKLGYAPEDWREFFGWAAQYQFPNDILVEGGLAAWREEHNPSRGVYARFRHRLMFPVMNENGSVIAFSGRVLSKDQKGGKYVNSPETPIFSKGRTLFGFHKTRRPITKAGHAIICEGQIDLISAVDAGVENIVAPLGTALTEDHAKALARQADEITLCFDSDNAGLKAAGKAFRTLAPKGMLVRLAFLPEGEDPDSYIKTYGLEAFQEVIKTAPEYFDFHIDRKGSGLSSGPLRDRLNFARDLAADIALVDNKMLQDSLINRIAVKLGVGEDELRKQIAGAAKVQARTEMNRARIEAREHAKALEKGHIPPKPTKIKIEHRSIRLLCRLFLTDPSVKLKYAQQAIPEFLNDLPEGDIFSLVWQGNYDPGHPASVHAFVGSLEEGLREAINDIMKTPIPGATAEWAEQALIDLEREYLSYKIDMLKSRQAAVSVEEQEANLKQILFFQQRRSDLANGSS